MPARHTASVYASCNAHRSQSSASAGALGCSNALATSRTILPDSRSAAEADYCSDAATTRCFRVANECPELRTCRRRNKLQLSVSPHNASVDNFNAVIFDAMCLFCIAGNRKPQLGAKPDYLGVVRYCDRRGARTLGRGHMSFRVRGRSFYVVMAAAGRRNGLY